MFYTVLAILLVLVLLDKGLTLVNIVQVNKNFPKAMEKDAYNIEKNPLAKWFFERAGLIKGTIIYGLFTLVMLYFVFLVLKFLIGFSIALYLIIILYSFVIANNSYFLLKFSGVIP